MLIGSMLMGAALAVTPTELHARLAEMAPLRAKRITEGVPIIALEHYDAAARHIVSTDLASVEGAKAKKAFGVIVLNAPIERVWAAVNDEESKTAYTRLGFLEVIEGKNCEQGRKVFQYLPIRFVSDRWWIVQQTQNDALFDASAGRVREVRWKSLDQAPNTPATKVWAEKGIRVGYTHGSWFLVDVDGTHTLVEYYAWTDPGGSIPAGVASSFAAGNIADTMLTMEKLALDGPKCPVR